MSRQSIPCDQYPGSTLPAKIQWVGDHFGPGANANTGNYTTGGYNLNSSAIGFTGIEFVQTGSYSESANYFARIFYPNVSGNTETRAATFASVNVKWYYAANSNEVANNTDLSAEVVRVFANGI